MCITLYLTFVTTFLCDAGDSVTRWATVASGCISSLIFYYVLLLFGVFAAVRTIASAQRWPNSLIGQLYPTAYYAIAVSVLPIYPLISMCNRQRIVMSRMAINV